MTPPRLLFIAERFPPEIGGVARSAGRIAAALADLGIDVHVLAWTKTLPSGNLVTEQINGGDSAGGLTLHRLGLFGGLDVSLQHTMNVLEWLHETHPFQAVWGHYLFPSGFAATLFANLRGIPVTVSIRGNDIDRLMFPPGDFARLLWTLERATVITAVSRDLAKKADLLLGRDSRTMVIRNAVDVETFRPQPPDLELKARLGIQDGEAVLGFCGELRHKKGLPHLLQALRAVREQRPARLLVIGEVRMREQAALSEFAAEYPESADSIVVTGHIESQNEIARHLAVCDVLLLPSLWDGLPNALLEALATGVPVLASDAGGIPEVIEHDRTGFVVPRSQLHRLGEAVLEVLTLAPEHRQRIVAAGRRLVEEQYSAASEAELLRGVAARLELTSAT